MSLKKTFMGSVIIGLLSTASFGASSKIGMSADILTILDAVGGAVLGSSSSGGGGDSSITNSIIAQNVKAKAVTNSQVNIVKAKFIDNSNIFQNTEADTIKGSSRVNIIDTDKGIKDSTIIQNTRVERISNSSINILEIGK